jgi:hypothetical protein
MVGSPDELERDYSEALRLLALPDFFTVKKPEEGSRLCRTCF